MSRIRILPGNEPFPRGASVNTEWLQMSPRFLLGVLEKYQDWMAAMDVQPVNSLQIIELYT